MSMTTETTAEVPPDLQPYYRSDPKRDRERLADPRALHAWARSRAILARFEELSAQEDQEIRAGKPLLTRRGDPGGARRYPPTATTAERKAAVGTNFAFDSSAIAEEDVQAYLHACRLADAAKQANTARNLDAGAEQQRANRSCECCGAVAQDRWALPVNRLREDLELRLCPSCSRTVGAELEVRERAERLPDGRTRGEAATTLVTIYLRSRS
jgi:hypothetical protein